jgi:ergothioneine biosynthesis protein EgtB
VERESKIREPIGGERNVMDRPGIIRRYDRVRARTSALVAPLSAEDMGMQSMPDASPTKWHLAHTTWFFAEFVLAPRDTGFRWPDERWRVLFNSYYEAAGPRHPRPSRGLISRPSLSEVLAWRAEVDDRMRALLGSASEDVLDVTLLGTHHEEQHQELILTDIQHALNASVLRPAYSPPPARLETTAAPLAWVPFEERIASIGHEGPGFAFDNEGPRHRALIAPFALASRPVTNAEYAQFVKDGGYARPDLWLSDGWATVRAEGWTAPLYWERSSDGWSTFSLHGVQALDRGAPVAHVSLYEADAYARWAGHRLPTEQEWEVAAAGCPVEGNFADAGLLVPAPPAAAAQPRRNGAVGAPSQLFGDVWEWTGSAYLPYPKYRPLAGALGEYNGKFMSGQMVLRGGSCLSPQSHLRATYRNFFPPHVRWQMTGIRLARDV